MSRYIDAEKLKERLGLVSVDAITLYEMGINAGLHRAEAEIEMLPTADVVEVIHGRWLSAYEYAIKLGETNEYRLGIAEHDKIWHFCSLCEQQVRFKRNFCPECGAKMDGERREG